MLLTISAPAFYVGWRPGGTTSYHAGLTLSDVRRLQSCNLWSLTEKGSYEMPTTTPYRLYAATVDAVARVDDPLGDAPAVTITAEGSGAQCVAVDPRDPNRVFAGTFDDGLLHSGDGGATWRRVGEDAIPHGRVLSVAISPSHVVAGKGVVYAGTEPSALYRSEDDGETWRDFPRLPELPSAPTWSFPPRPWTSHVRWIAPHPGDPALLFVGIELGGVMRSVDGGETWEDRKPGSQPDSHALATHPTAHDRVYEAAGGGVAWSHDRGTTWEPYDAGMDRHYAWGIAVDPADPDLWYVSASVGAHAAHSQRGDARAVLYRSRGGANASWQPLGSPAQAGSNGTPLHHPNTEMPYALLTLPDHPNTLLVGLRNGTLLVSDNAGDSFRTISLDRPIPGILALTAAPLA
jgi:photosystem II stability/assembly factor-like uncharacterized protein